MIQEVAVTNLHMAKNSFQVHGTTADGGLVFRRQLRRSGLQSFFEVLERRLAGIVARASPTIWRGS